MKICEVVGRGIEKRATDSIEKTSNRIAAQASSAQNDINGSSTKQPVANVVQSSVPLQSRTPSNKQLQPSVVKQQSAIGKVVGQIAASDQKRQPTEDNIVQAMWAYREMQKRTDQQYAQSLRQQLAKAENVQHVASVSTAR